METMKIPQNKSLKNLARDLRKNATLAEVLLWNELKNRQFCNLDFDRQKIIGNYIADFYCPSLKLVIEVDGNSHDNKLSYDLVRDDYFKFHGLNVIHFSDNDVKHNMGVVLEYIGRFITTTPSLRDTPSPAEGDPHTNNL